jgi:hypothetical protein
LLQNSRSKHEKETPKNETKRKERKIIPFLSHFPPEKALHHGLKIMRQV